MTAAFDTAFANAELVLSAAFGADGVLRGSVLVSGVVISRGVAIVGDYGQTVRRVDTASLPFGTAARSGDTLAVGAESWVLDHPMDNASGRPEFALRAAP